MKQRCEAGCVSYPLKKHSHMPVTKRPPQKTLVASTLENALSAILLLLVLLLLLQTY